LVKTFRSFYQSRKNIRIWNRVGQLIKDYIDFNMLADEWERQLCYFPMEIHEVKLACSGHVDSIALFDLLCRFCQEKKISFTGVMHVNYKRRGQDSESDQDLVASLCKDAKLAFHRLELPKDAFELQGAGNFQEWAREQRYQFFNQHLDNNHTLIALAHHANDLAENVVMRMARGTRLDNLLGMVEARAPFWRPLLRYSKKAIERYATERALTYRNDETNSSTNYARNAVRHEVLAVLERCYPGASQRLIELALETQALSEFVESRFQVGLAHNSAFFPIAELKSISPYLALQVLSRMIAMVSTKRPNLQRRQLLGIAQQIRELEIDELADRRWQVGGQYLFWCEKEQVKAWSRKNLTGSIDTFLQIPAQSQCQLALSPNLTIIINAEKCLSPQRVRLYAPEASSEVSFLGAQRGWQVKRLIARLKSQFGPRLGLWFLVSLDNADVGVWFEGDLWLPNEQGKLCPVQAPLVSIKLVRSV